MAAIGVIRNKFGWALVLLMVVSLIAFILMSSESGGGSNGFKVSDDLAIVDGNSIKNTAFTERLNNSINNYRQQSKSATISEAEMNSIRNSTYNQMVSESILKNKYDKLGLMLSDEEFRDMTTGDRVHQALKNSFQDASGNFDLDAFNNYVQNLDEENPGDEPGTKRKSWKNYENGIINERLSNKFNAIVEKSLTIPTVMAKDKYLNDQSQVSFNYVKIPFSSIKDSLIDVSDSDLTAHMNKNKSKYEKDPSVGLKIASFPLKYSANDKIEAEKWMSNKLTEWKESNEDSLFLTLYSDETYDQKYYGQNELVSQYKEEIFAGEIGDIFGFDLVGDQFIATKLLDKKLIADSLQARHLLLSFDQLKTNEEVFAKRQLFDSLYSLIKDEGYSLESLTAKFSEDESNKNNGGDLNWVKPNQMVSEFNNLIFFNMKEGDVKVVGTQFGLHIVEVYKATPTKESVQIGLLKKQILPSKKTQENTYAQASSFAGNNNTKDKFLAAGEDVLLEEAFDITKDKSTIQGVQGNARSIVKWAFKEAALGQVSSPFFIGDSYYVVMLSDKNEKGLPNITDNNRLNLKIDVINAKKSEMIKAKIKGTELESIASSNNQSVQNASGISYSNTTLEGVKEPKVTGAALGLKEGETSKPIVGTDGVYILNLTSISTPQDDPSAYNSNKESIFNQYKFGITGGLNNALIESADLEDNRLDFF